ncbi:MAG: glycosyltransferase family 1 protein, partial [Chloroflexi bacterium]|nr:glycosyltransferase family 1 protein [Chloroflexota bacterium]
LTDALVSLVREDALRTRLSALGLAHAHTFAWETTAQQTLTAYRSVL